RALERLRALLEEPEHLEVDAQEARPCPSATDPCGCCAPSGAPCSTNSDCCCRATSRPPSRCPGARRACRRQAYPPGPPPAAPPPRAAARRLGALARRERPLRVAVARRHQVPVLPRVGVEDGERAKAAPLLPGLDDGDGHAVEAAPLHARVEVARVADRPPHDVEEALGEAREGEEPAPVRELARDRREEVD